MKKCPVEKCPSGLEEFETIESHFQSCIDRHHEAAAHIVAHLRNGVRHFTEFSFINKAQRAAALKEIEKVLEISKVAEAKFEGLFSRWGAGWLP